jgi:hypothetical protein
MADLIGMPSYATSIGLVAYALQGQERWTEAPATRFETPGGGLFRRLASLGKSLMPQ